MPTYIAGEQEKDYHKYHIQNGQNPPHQLSRLILNFILNTFKGPVFTHGTFAEPFNGQHP